MTKRQDEYAITTINLKYENGEWKEWISWEKLGGNSKLDEKDE